MLKRINYSEVILAITSMFICYFGYLSGYTKNVFSIETFQSQYSNGVYQNRPVASYLLLFIDGLLRDMIGDMKSYRVLFMDSKGDLSFYVSYFVLNTIFFITSVILLRLILEKIKVKDTIIKYNILLYIFLISISQFVVVPYDTLIYSFILAFIYLYIGYLKAKNLRKYLLLGLLSLIVLLGSYVRETIALCLSFAFTLAFLKRRPILESFIELSVLSSFFLVGFLSIRYLNQNSTVMHFSLYETFKDIRNYVGLLFFVSLSRILFNQNRSYLVFLVASSPYLFAVILGGIFFEIRLFVPLVFVGKILSFLEDRALLND